MINIKILINLYKFYEWQIIKNYLIKNLFFYYFLLYIINMKSNRNEDLELKIIEYCFNELIKYVEFENSKFKYSFKNCIGDYMGELWKI